MNRMFTFLATAFMVAGMLLGWAMPAQAQSDDDLNTQGEEAMLSEDYPAAIQAYSTLSERYPNQWIYASNIGIAYMKSGQPCQGIDWFEKAMKKPDFPKEVEQKIRDRFLKNAACWTISVTVTPPEGDVTIKVDDNVVGRTSNDGVAVIARQFTTVGTIKVTAITADKRTESIDVELEAGKGNKDLTIKVPEPPEGSIVVTCKSESGKGGDVFYKPMADGDVPQEFKLAGFSDHAANFIVKIPNLVPGDYIVRCKPTDPNDGVDETTVTVKPNQATEVTLAPQGVKTDVIVDGGDEPDWQTIGGYTGIIGGGTLVIVGLVFEGLFHDRVGKLEEIEADQRNGVVIDDAQAAKTYDQAQTFRTTGRLLWGFGLAAATTGVVLLVVGDDESDQPVGVSPIIGGDTAGAVITIEFP